MTLTELEFRQANASQPKVPRAEQVHYDTETDCVVIRLDSGVSLSFPPRLAQGLAGAKPAQLARIDISPSGQGLHFPALDVDLHLPALINGVLGSASWMAGQLGRKGGSRSTEAKSRAARENGKLGGRPRKRPAL
ncbi:MULTISPECIES: DUF2442 domain-containing protein [Pseudomonas]|uniref:DUF2442 domain-containing protein n=1 Tax=Pseudomonas asplenii TaxID=53407 RepID=A0A0M9GD00_9PSED|nr:MULTISPECIES: DUF2442 domain-containing protein [Pseudomonas]KPA87898.1 Protein of unknown function (DUF2442) [Pseudomonas fuscovaginae]KPA97757.1 Protein of unknown function (DUF2442) [Pseudomonas fuscovaginae]